MDRHTDWENSLRRCGRCAACGVSQSLAVYTAGVSISKASFLYVLWSEVGDFPIRDLIRATRAIKGMESTGTTQRRTMMAKTQSG